MKCLTIMEPYGTLIALGEKKIETRSWKTNYRGKLAIHTSKSMNKESRSECLKEAYYSILCHDYVEHSADKKTKFNFNFGSIIAVCDLVDCVKMEHLSEEYAVLENGLKVSGNELTFGNFEPGRYAWILENVQMLKEPIRAKGQLGVWNCQMPML